MKTTLKSFIVMGLMAVSFISQAQKIAFIELDSLVSLMPEMIQARKASEDYSKQLQSELADMQKELNEKSVVYKNNEKTYTDLVKQTKQKELQDLNQRLQDFQQQAQADFQKKNVELMKPINEKAKKAIAKVAKAKGYKIVLDTTLGGVLYYEPTDDIFLLVKAELGIK
jgi:outer membrane protein